MRVFVSYAKCVGVKASRRRSAGRCGSTFKSATAAAGAVTATAGAVTATADVATATAGAAAIGILSTLQERVDVDELGFLQELAAGDVQLRGLLGQEADVQGFEVLPDVKVLLLLRTAWLVLQRAVERAEAVNLHLFRLQQHLDEARAKPLQHAVHHIGRVDRAVLRDVLRQPARVQRFEVLHLREVLAVSSRLRVLVLFHFIDNLCHSCVFSWY